ncbi:hypothetical protein KCP71_07530 [Salmonella enterica subsp. enterica]|nr:hypothetical protein KCP71_07530 [Salmonella enterica subsp. enterica]
MKRGRGATGKRKANQALHSVTSRCEIQRQPMLATVRATERLTIDWVISLARLSPTFVLSMIDNDGVLCRGHPRLA